MKIKKILAGSLMCAILCSSLPLATAYADENVEEVKLKIHSTSSDEVNGLISGSEFVPSVLDIKKVSKSNEEYSLVTEEDSKIPEEIKPNVFYTKEDIKLRTSTEDSSEVISIIPKGTEIETEFMGDKFAAVTVEGKTGIVPVEYLTFEKVEHEEKQTEEKVDNKETKAVKTEVSEDKGNAVQEQKSTEEQPKEEQPKEEQVEEEKPVVTETPKKVVTLYSNTTLNVRSGAGTSYSRLGSLYYGQEITGNDLGECIEFDFNGQTGYVSKDYLVTEKPQAPVVESKPETPSKNEENTNTVPSSNSSDVETVVQAALAQVGKRYVWAASNPNVGFDCSGLVYYAFKQVGVTLNRIAADQYYNGTPVSRNQLQRGDLVFFSSGGYIGHVGLYIGNGQFVHASDYSTGVIISNLSGYYSNTYAGAVRVLK